MGMLVEGKWTDRWYDTKSTGGRFERKDSSFRNWIKADGSTDFEPESGRYHLYVSLACPWAHRTVIYRRLKGLEGHITISVVSPIMLENGWTFEEGEGSHPRHRERCGVPTPNLHRGRTEIYRKSDCTRAVGPFSPDDSEQ